MMKSGFILALLLVPILLLASSTLPAQTETATPTQTATVGVMKTIESLVLHGPELELKPIDNRKTPIIIRIAAVYPHGDGHRYDLEWYGMETGTFNLCDYLQQTDGLPASGLKPVLVEVVPIRPPGQVEPHRLTQHPTPQLGGYRALLWVLGFFWMLGLIAIITSFFLPRAKDETVSKVKTETLAERLQPLIQQATQGKLTTTELARLERGLLIFWRKKLHLDSASADEAFRKLRAHPEAGPLLAQLEAWLHSPKTEATVDVPKLLAPYQNLAATELDLNEGRPS